VTSPIAAKDWTPSEGRFGWQSPTGKTKRSTPRFLGQGYVLLDSYLASDEIICDSARVLPERKIIGGLALKDADLIGSMMEGRHGTPIRALGLPLHHQSANIRHPRMASASHVLLQTRSACAG